VQQQRLLLLLLIHIARKKKPSMGIQSQNRNGSIKWCMRNAHKRRKTTYNATKGGWIQSSISPFEKRAFMPERNCVLCRAYYRRRFNPLVRIPHRGHHKLCSLNNTTKGQLSKRSIEVLEYAEKMLEKNNTPPVLDGPTLGTTAQQKEGFLHPNGSASACDDSPMDFSTDGNQTVLGESCNTQTLLATELRKRVDAIVTKLGDKPSVKDIIMSVSREIFESMNIKRSRTPGEMPTETDHFVQKMAVYRKYFAPGEITFTFPQEVSTEAPSPYYHMIEGCCIGDVDWERSHLGVKLACPCCNDGNPLQRAYTNLSKNSILLNVHTYKSANLCMLTRVMHYRCLRCKEVISGVDGRLLAKLPAHARAVYPVSPEYAIGKNTSFQVAQDVADDLRESIKTYSNPQQFTAKLYRRQGLEFERKAATYVSVNANQERKDFVLWANWIKGFYPPSPDSFKNHYQHSEESKLGPTGISNDERYTRELQSVITKEGAAFDWTFALIHNYFRSKAKACCTAKTSMGLWAGAVLVPSTKISDAAHFIEQMARRPGFNLRVLYTDTWPSNNQFWFGIFGASLLGRLGLFHFLKRLLEFLDPRCEIYWKALDAYKATVYSYNPTDYSALIQVLQNGTMSHAAKPMSDPEILDLKESKNWKHRASRFLRKILHQSANISFNWAIWSRDYLQYVDTQGRALVKDKEGFKKAEVEQLKKTVRYIQDPENMEMYVSIPPGPNSTHGLTSYKSKRCESALENGHLKLAHYANNGSSEVMADLLSMRGIAEDNVEILHELARYEGKQVVSDPNVKGYLEDVSPFQNHLLLGHINRAHAAAGLKPPFSFVTVVGPDTGEVFLGRYLHQQLKRNERGEYSSTDRRCTCRICLGSGISLPHESGDAQTQQQPLPPAQVAPHPLLLVPPTPAPAPRLLLPVLPAPAPRLILPALASRQMSSRLLPVMPMNAMWHPAYQVNLASNVYANACCTKNWMWKLNDRRMGRPPHDLGCKNHPRNKNK
jgi:hypothetical protein